TIHFKIISHVLKESKLKSHLNPNTNVESNKYATFDLLKILGAESPSLNEKCDPNVLYTPWPCNLKLRPVVLGLTLDQPRLPELYSTQQALSSPKPCENPIEDHYLVKSIKNKIDYCKVHGIEIFYNMALLDVEIAGLRAKLSFIHKLLLSHPEVEFL
ncbi:Xyloglucan 6-xylosyltransferase 2, partial [Mucuna pruriens]